MSYEVLARKWRPKNFSELAGQDSVQRTLSNAIKKNRLYPVLLFSGPRGTGKTSTARILAKTLRCQNRKELIPCEACDDCRMIQASRHLDVIEIDGASNNGVDAVRELRSTVSYMPSSGSWKIYIIDEVHMLSNSAFNALLKTLEEPPQHVVFVMATTESHKIPLTVLSRAQKLDFHLIPPHLIKSHLETICKKEGFSVKEEVLWTAARQARGSMRDGQSLLDQIITFCGEDSDKTEVTRMLGLSDPDLLLDCLRALVHRKEKDMLDVIGRLKTKGGEPLVFLQSLIEGLAQMLFLKQNPDNKPRLVQAGEQEIHEIKQNIDSISYEDLHFLFDMFLKGEREMSFCHDSQMVLEVLLLRFCSAPRLEEIVPFQGAEEEESKPVEREKAKPAKGKKLNLIEGKESKLVERKRTNPAEGKESNSAEEKESKLVERKRTNPAEGKESNSAEGKESKLVERKRTNPAEGKESNSAEEKESKLVERKRTNPAEGKESNSAEEKESKLEKTSPATNTKPYSNAQPNKTMPLNSSLANKNLKEKLNPIEEKESKLVEGEKAKPVERKRTNPAEGKESNSAEEKESKPEKTSPATNTKPYSNAQPNKTMPLNSSLANKNLKEKLNPIEEKESKLVEREKAKPAKGKKLNPIEEKESKPVERKRTNPAEGKESNSIEEKESKPEKTSPATNTKLKPYSNAQLNKARPLNSSLANKNLKEKLNPIEEKESKLVEREKAKPAKRQEILNGKQPLKILNQKKKESATGPLLNGLKNPHFEEITQGLLFKRRFAFLSFVKEKAPTLAPYLENMCLKEKTKEGFCFLIPSNISPWLKGKTSSSDTHQKLENLLTEFLQSPQKIKFSLCKEGEPALSLMEEKKIRDKESFIKQTQSDPFINKIKELFDADIKPLY